MADFRLKINLQLFSQEKTEEATPKKKQDSRKKGQVAKSMDVPAAFILFFSFLSFSLFGAFMKDRLIGLFHSTLHDFLLLNLTVDNIIVLFEKISFQLLLIVGPIFLIAMVIAVISNYLQFGFLLTGEPLMMKFNKINPIQGAKNLFSLRALVDFAKSVLKMSIIGAVVYTTLMGEKEYIMRLAQMPLEEIALFTWSLIVSLGLKIGLILIVLAIFDYMYQRYEHGKSIRMSKQDIKDEYKKSEGDPLIKGKIREKQRRMALQRMMQEVPKADVVITNPTHFAVAIKYDGGQMQAPTVIAKGTDYIALKIKQIANDNGVITMENKPLARALYAQVEIGESIPADMFQAVAEVLAYVYKLKGKAN
ncbi:MULTISPECIES: flagellar biosynthesis protein FlhB [unclassified Paenibacillus]|uniref:flagellar biosynthesis protein FlhB n=1 Tax=unclassified Paenibacillus TaxID=185978 RepID=UPI001AE567BA|nr:flagellar biosynthetic protein FlhB [Paenibacillus sp. PvP091]MBP1168622.1 flagellar biosynthetic protein FlhB [Paenibacillus sp. PvR098]MBP2439650.1 flagellar biosynthetic protein FlhB [Paenibacillus sp. PvP052]